MTSSNSSYMTSREFLKMAIEFEKSAVAFYQSLQEKVDPGAASQLLLMLEKEEAQHVTMLEQWVLGQPEAMIQFPPELTEDMPSVPEGNLSLSDLIDLATERERIAKESYQAAARSVTGEFKAMLEAFAVFEEEHEEKLRSMRNI